MEIISTFERILMVEDDSKDVELSLAALEEFNLANEVFVARDGIGRLLGRDQRAAPGERREVKIVGK